MDEADDISVLLDSTRLTKVGELRALAIGIPTLQSVLHTTVELREGDDGDIKFLSEHLEGAGDGTDLLLSVAEVHPAGIHELQVVDDDDLHLMLTHQTTRLGT